MIYQTCLEHGHVFTTWMSHFFDVVVGVVVDVDDDCDVVVGADAI